MDHSSPESEVVSSFFKKETISRNYLSDKDLSEEFLYMIDELNLRLDHLELPNTIDCIYNPTLYAGYTFKLYVHKYCKSIKPIMYFGMNPGPWGMSQTGVPFGEISMVRDWLLIEGPVEKPVKELKSRPVEGFNCKRTEVSGKRFWGLFKDICGTADNFFETSFVYNYLPQQWLKSNGCNLTPGDFKASEMQELFNICDPTFIKVLKLYEVKTIVAVGKFCETRAQKAIKKYLPSSNIRILYMPHPSPRVVNNNDWNQKAFEHLKKLDLLQYYTQKEIT